MVSKTQSPGDLFLDTVMNLEDNLLSLRDNIRHRKALGDKRYISTHFNWKYEREINTYKLAIGWLNGCGHTIKDQINEESP